MVFGERSHLVFDRLRWRGVFRDVLTDHPPTYRLIQTLMSGGMDYPNTAGGQLLFQLLSVQSVKLHRREFFELDLTQSRDDVESCGLLGALVGAKTDAVLRGL